MTVRAVSNNPASPHYNASCPNLTGQAGSLTTWLDAVLVNGFSGFAGLGWTIGQTTSNKRQYVMAAGGTGNSLWVDDATPTTAKEARVSGYATMSATTPTGTGQFPTNAQSAIGTGMLVIRKSATADSTTRYATCIGDGHTFYLFTETGDFTAPTGAFCFKFGDFYSLSASDTSNCMIEGRNVENSTSCNSSATWLDASAGLCVQSTTPMTTTLPGCFAAANFTNVGGSLAYGKQSDQTKMGYSSSAVGAILGYAGYWTNGGNNVTFPNAFAYPNGPDGGLYAAPVAIHHNGNLRGYLKGFWNPLQHMPLAHNDVFTGTTGNLNGKSLCAQTMVAPTNASSNVAGTAGQCYVEYSDTWTAPS